MIFTWLFGILFSFPISKHTIQYNGPHVSDSLSVYVFLHDECVISQFYTPLLTDYHNNYKHKKIGFIGWFMGSRIVQVTNKSHWEHLKGQK